MSDDIVTRLRNWAPCWALHDQISIDLNQGADEIERLRAERDEARREVCNLRPSVCLGAQTAVEFANHRGWDCFKERDDARP